MGVTNERHPASITTTSLTLICGIVAGTVYITFQYLTGEKAIAGAAAIFAASMLRLHLVGYHWKKNISNSLLLLDIGENGRLNPAFSAAFFAFDDKLFEFEDAASSG